MRKIIYTTVKIKRIFDIIDKIKNSDIPVLIQGETGTGKELFAEYIQSTSLRSNNKFVKINCAAIPENLIESELFGHTKGAFTGAERIKTGLFEHANNGTIFLDEIGDLNNIAQTKLLRVAQDGTFRRVGGNDTEKTNIRLICATNRGLFDSNFRKDLYYRLAVVVIDVPALRDRKEDIKILAEYFADIYAKKLKINVPVFSEKAIEKLINYNWPGNVRELENTIYQAVLLAENKIIKESDIIIGTSVFTGKTEFKSLDLIENEKYFIRLAMKEGDGMQTIAAKLLGISARALNYKLKLYGMR